MQIVPMVTITPIPQASTIADGIINVHGETVPVVDLRRHLGKPKHQFHFFTPIILVKTREQLVGLIVDNIQDVVSLPVPRIVHPSEILPEELHDVSLLTGVAYLPDAAALMLDPDQLFQPVQVQMLTKACEYMHEPPPLPNSIVSTGEQVNPPHNQE